MLVTLHISFCVMKLNYVKLTFLVPEKVSTKKVTDCSFKYDFTVVTKAQVTIVFGGKSR